MSADKRQRLWRLPEEITETILARLPADDLARFKLVCKNWRSLISSPGFVSAHLKHSQSVPSNHQILLRAYDWGKELAGPSRSVICCASHSVKIVGSVNGLICLAGDDHDGPSPDDIWIMNPLIGHSIKLPPPPSPVETTLYDSSWFSFAFSCDSVTNAYKVARIVSYGCKKSDPDYEEGWDLNPKIHNPNRADVWDSSSPETWREIPIGFRRPFRPPFWVTENDIVVGGCAYWIVADFNYKDLFVLSLDMNTLLLKPISLPHLSMNFNFAIECLVQCRPFLFLTNWKGRFALVARKENYIKEVGDTYTIWTIKDGSSGAWNPPISLHLDFLKGYHLMSINGKLFRRRPPFRKTTLYDMETQSFEDLAIGGVSVSSAHDFVGSLVTITGFKTEPHISQLLTFVWPKHGTR